MKIYPPGKTRLVVASLFLTGLLALSSQWLSAAEPQSPSEPLAGPSASPAMQVYLDPETGEFGVPPPELEASSKPKGSTKKAALKSQSLSTAPEELVEVPGTTEAGGFTVELNGQFQSFLTVTPDADGKISIRCGDEHPDRD